MAVDIATSRGADALCVMSSNDAFVARATAGEHYIFSEVEVPAYSALREKILSSPLLAFFVSLTHAPLLPGAGAAVSRFSDPLESREHFDASAS